MDDATLELLLDLKHDLGKYLLLPLALLPKNADDAAVREALRRALLETRTRRVTEGSAAPVQSRHLGAAEIWRAGRVDLVRAGCSNEALAALEQAVERALAWQSALSDPAPLDRAAAERDLSAVQSAITALLARSDEP